MDDQHAIAQIKQGDISGLEFLVRKYQKKAVYSAYLVLQDRQLAEDAAQNAFLRVYERIGQFDDTRPLEPWLIRIVVNTALDMARKRSRWDSLDEQAETTGDADLKWLWDGQPPPENLVETQELCAEVRKALKTLSPDQRAAVVLRYFLGMGENEMTDALQRPTGTIKWWLHEAKRRLRKILRPAYEDPGKE